jgi:peptide chain release factor 2
MEEILKELQKRLLALDHLMISDLKQKIKDLEEEMTKPDFWKDRFYAQKVSKEIELKKALLQKYKSISEKLEDLEVLWEIAEKESELKTLADELSKELRALELRAFMSGKYDRKDCYLTINAGAGGTDAQDWAEMLLRMYSRWLDRKGFRWRLLEVSPGEVTGIKSATLEVKGEFSYGHLKSERGVHRLVRISPFDANRRRHTSFASVKVIPKVDVEVEIDENDLHIETYRASSAGGQHVNVTDSAVRITHKPTGITAQCQNERSQHQNKETALKVLKARLYELKEREKEEEIRKLQGELKKIEWGSQIRSYVFHPYQLVKDHRTGVEVSDVERVMDGDIDEFIEGYLKTQVKTKEKEKEKEKENKA